MRKFWIIPVLSVVVLFSSCNQNKEDISGYRPISIGKNYAYANIEKGKLPKGRYADAGDFHEGFAVVLTTKRNYGIMDKYGHITLIKNANRILDFSEGLAAVQVKDKWGFIDTEGKWIIEPQYFDAESFSDGFALVGLGPNGYPKKFITHENKTAFPETYDSDACPDSFSNGFAEIGSMPRVYYIDNTGKPICDSTYNSGLAFSDGAALVQVLIDGTPKLGFIDGKGSWIIEPEYDHADSFYEGLATVGIGDTYYVIDKKNHRTPIGQYTSADSPHSGIIRIKVGDEYGYINIDGHVIHKPDIEDADDFNGPMARIAKIIPDGEFNIEIAGYMLADGTEIWGDDFINRK